MGYGNLAVTLFVFYYAESRSAARLASQKRAGGIDPQWTRITGTASSAAADITLLGCPKSRTERADYGRNRTSGQETSTTNE
jgi:hypothetical protein